MAIIILFHIVNEDLLTREKMSDIRLNRLANVLVNYSAKVKAETGCTSMELAGDSGGE